MKFFLTLTWIWQKCFISRSNINNDYFLYFFLECILVSYWHLVYFRIENGSLLLLEYFGTKNILNKCALNEPKIKVDCAKVLNLLVIIDNVLWVTLTTKGMTDYLPSPGCNISHYNIYTVTLSNCPRRQYTFKKKSDPWVFHSLFSCCCFVVFCLSSIPIPSS